MNQRQKHTLIAALVGLLGIVLILIVVWFFSREHRFKKYHNEENEFSISYPARWEFQEGPEKDMVTFVSPQANDLDFFRESINVVVQDVTADEMDLKDYSEVAIEEMRMVFRDNFILLESGLTILSGEPGYKIVFLGKNPTSEAKFMIVWILKDLKSYTITYTALASQYDRYELYVKRMLMSFRLD